MHDREYRRALYADLDAQGRRAHEYRCLLAQLIGALDAYVGDGEPLDMAPADRLAAIRRTFDRTRERVDALDSAPVGVALGDLQQQLNQYG